MRRGLAYDEAATLGELDAIRAAFPAGRLSGLAASGDDLPLPVFVVGMPRSGTSLVEQILASHPLVSAPANWMPGWTARACASRGYAGASIPGCRERSWPQSGRRYLERVARRWRRRGAGSSTRCRAISAMPG